MKVATSSSPIAAALIERTIFLIPGYKVILDADLAVLYRVELKALNQAVKRNRERFPRDFMFRLAPAEAARLRSQIVTLRLDAGSIGSTCPTSSPSREWRSPASSRTVAPSR
jgi:hypothetical protein